MVHSLVGHLLTVVFLKLASLDHFYSCAMLKGLSSETFLLLN